MTLSALIARVEEGAEKDRLLDRDIWIALGWAYEKRGKDRKPWLYEPARPSGYSFRKDPGDSLGWHISKMDLTGSLDAVLSLIEQKLPDALVRLSNEYQGFWRAEVRLSKSRGCHSPARALLAATLRALSALEDSKADLADATNGDRP